MEKKTLSSRIERAVRFSAPYEVRNAVATQTKDRIFIRVDYNPMLNDTRRYVDDRLLIVVENVMVANGCRCVDHNRLPNGHTYEYALMPC